MPSSTSSSDPSLTGEVAVARGIAISRPGFVRLTAADRPGVAQPVPVRDIPPRPWPRILAATLSLLLIAVGAWEWRMRTLGLEAGDLDDGPSFWAEQRRRIDAGDVAVAIVGDSRILYDTDLERFERLAGVRPLQLAIAGSTALPFLEDLADAPNFKGLAIVGIADRSYFRGGGGLGGWALDRYRFESPAVHTSFLLYRSLSRTLAFLDEKYRLNSLVRLLDGGWRAGVQLPVNERLWKLGTVIDDRQTYMWARVESDARVRAHQGAAWVRFRAVPGRDRHEHRTKISVGDRQDSRARRRSGLRAAAVRAGVEGLRGTDRVAHRRLGFAPHARRCARRAFRRLSGDAWFGASGVQPSLARLCNGVHRRLCAWGRELDAEAHAAQ